MIPIEHADTVRRSLTDDRDRLLQSFARTEDGWELLKALRLHLMIDDAAPAELRANFLRRLEMVESAQVLSLDDAFGRYWPKRTRLHTVRRHEQLKKAIHAHVWDLAGKCGWRINRQLFARISNYEDVACSASVAERLYYEAVNTDGMPSVAVMRSGLSPLMGSPLVTAEQQGR